MLIIDMPMPKGCTWTDENENGHLCPLLDIDCDCVLQEKGRKIGWAERYAKCPIKGVLPDEHGDLIDRDALYMKIKSHNTERPDRTYRMGLIAEKHICLDDICRAKAVIEAERKDDEQIH